MSYKYRYYLSTNTIDTDTTSHGVALATNVDTLTAHCTAGNVTGTDVIAVIGSLAANQTDTDNLGYTRNTLLPSVVAAVIPILIGVFAELFVTTALSTNTPAAGVYVWIAAAVARWVITAPSSDVDGSSRLPAGKPDADVHCMDIMF